MILCAEEGSKMDNIIFEKLYIDGNLIELRISASSTFVSAYQNCYVDDSALKEMTDKVLNYVVHYDKSCYLEFGEKEGNYAPAFSMCILPASVTGHLKIEVDIEIDDNNKRCHRCCFYVNSELGLIEKGSVLKFWTV